MRDIGPGQRLRQHLFIGDRKAHTLFFDNAAGNGNQRKLPNLIFLRSRRAGAHHPHLVSVAAQRLRKALSRYGRSVIGIVKLVDHQQNFHSLSSFRQECSRTARPSLYQQPSGPRAHSQDVPSDASRYDRQHDSRLHYSLSFSSCPVIRPGSRAARHCPSGAGRG